MPREVRRGRSTPGEGDQSITGNTKWRSVIVPEEQEPLGTCPRNVDWESAAGGNRAVR